MHRILQFSACLLAIFGGTSPLSMAQTNDAELAAKIERLIKPYVEAKQLVGVSVGVVQGDREATVHMGVTKVGGDVADDATVYEIGSTSKVFTGLLLADAVIQEKVTLNQPAKELLPKGIGMPSLGGRDITLLDLATHRSGLPKISDNMPMKNAENPYADYRPRLAYDFLNKYHLTRTPGDSYEYSNLGMALLGQLIVRQAKMSYDRLLKQRITEPLAMENTAVDLSMEMKKHLATPHLEPGTSTSTWEFAGMPGAGGIRSTTADMMKFIRANISPPDNEVGKAIELAWQKHHDAKESSESMGLAWHFTSNQLTHWHNGQTGGFHSMLMVGRPKKLGLILLTNTASMEADQLAGEIMLLLRGKDVKPRVFSKAKAVDAAVMQRYVGQYELIPEFVFTVSVVDGKLMVGITNQPTLQVFPKSDTEWEYRAVPAALKFVVDANGKCTGLQLLQGGVTQSAKRIR